GPVLARTIPPWRALGAAACVALPCSGLYLASVGEAATLQAFVENPVSLRMASANLASMAGPTPEIDRTDHSLALALSGTILALCAISPRLVGTLPRWRTLLGTGVAALVLSMGTELSTSPYQGGPPLPLALFHALPGGDLLRFPARLAWAWLLCGGVLAACCATNLAQRVGPRARWLLVLAAVDAFILVRLPHRQVSRLATVPSAYTESTGAVLDLLPEDVNPNGELGAWMTGLSCYYQLRHDRPIADDCVRVTVQNRRTLGRWLGRTLLAGEAQLAHRGLTQLGFTSVAFHPDLFTEGDRRRLQHGLALLDPDPVSSQDGGEVVAVYRVHPMESGTGQETSPGTSSLPCCEPPEGSSTSLGAREQTPISEVSSLRIELVAAPEPAANTPGFSPPDDADNRRKSWTGTRSPPDRRYLAQLMYQGTSLGEVELFNGSLVPGDSPRDQTWSALWTGPLAGDVSLALLSIESPGRTDRHVVKEDTLPTEPHIHPEATVLWKGPLSLQADHDRVTFLVENDVAAPITTAPHTFSPAANLSSGSTAAVGWFVWMSTLLIAGLVRLRPGPGRSRSRRASGRRSGRRRARRRGAR
ncbi:MAG: hypothetical protein QGG40_00410, partial [Myxococcota bacterium]|nr:hypothetical protein [Myxococcota bacterium]